MFELLYSLLVHTCSLPKEKSFRYPKTVVIDDNQLYLLFWHNVRSINTIIINTSTKTTNCLNGYLCPLYTILGMYQQSGSGTYQTIVLSERSHLHCRFTLLLHQLYLTLILQSSICA